MWDEEQGDLTQDIHSTKPIKKTTGVALFEESGNTLSFQNAGNAMNYYVIFSECDSKYVRLVKESQVERWEK